MRKWLVAAAFGLAAAYGPVSGSFAADLEDRYGSAHDDPRHADIYRRSAPPPYTEHQPYDRHDQYDRYARPPVPQEPMYRDDDYGYQRGPHPRRYGEAPAPYGAGRPGCVPKSVVRESLARGGWLDLHDAELADRETARVKARRPNGRLFVIEIDRCTGAVIAARPLFGRGYGPYAYDGPRRPNRMY